MDQRPTQDASDDHLPRFGIRHLIGWAVGVAVSMAGTGPHYIFLAGPPLVVQPIMTKRESALLAAPNSVVIGAMFLVVGVTLQGYIRRRQWRWQPGQQLAILGVVEWLRFTLLLSLSPLHLNAFCRTVHYYTLGTPLVHFVLGVWFYVLLLRSGQTRQWKNAMAAHVFLPLLYLLWPMSLSFLRPPKTRTAQIAPVFQFFYLIPLVQAVLILSAMVFDWRRRQSPHWSHNLGSGAQLAALLLGLGWKVFAPRRM
jgi:hypothetical protein